MAKLKLYGFFHLNLAYSSIPEGHFKLIIERCYWPLLKLIEGLNIPLGIEAPAHTLMQINKIDNQFITKLIQLWQEDKCEFIGSAFTQSIFPLIPARINRENLLIGKKYYGEVLGRVPSTVLVNEQCYSQGLPSLYLEAGYKNLIAEWNNSYKYNKYPKDYQHYPQVVVGADNAKMNIIWNNSISFQKFQRCVHQEIDIDDYSNYLVEHIGSDERAFILYGNDAEVFNYRPGRTPPQMDEFQIMQSVFKTISGDSRFEIIKPTEVVEYFKNHPKAMKEIRLESTENPIPCKKQEKYNASRWAVCGKNNSVLNSKCYKIYETGNIRELCYLWASDFRSFTTNAKAEDCKQKLQSMEPIPQKKQTGYDRLKIIKKDKREIIIEHDVIKLVLDKDRGLAVRSLIFKEISNSPLIGTIPHGYYEDISYGADFYSSNIIIVTRDGRKITDLSPVEPIIEEDSIFCTLETPVGILGKGYHIHDKGITLFYKLNLNNLESCSFRLGIITLLPVAFDKDNLFFATHNGGRQIERFSLNGKRVRQDEAVSQLVSSSGCLGATEGWIAVGDNKKAIKISSDRKDLYPVPMISYEEIDDSFFFRVYHSISELDETANAKWDGHYSLSFTISPIESSKII